MIVADPNFAPMYARRSRKVKTDRRDARALAEACRLGAYRPAHRTSAEQRHVRDLLSVRDAMMKSRTQYISLIRALLRMRGLRVPSGSAETFVRRLPLGETSETLREAMRPLVQLLEQLNRQLVAVERSLAREAAADQDVLLLETAPEVGLITASGFSSAIERPERFRNAHQVEAYLGLVPRELSSGEKQRRGPITKGGAKRPRWLLVEAGWRLLRSTDPRAQALRQWGLRIAARRGKQIAAVALARRLAGILFAMWRDRRPFQPELVGRKVMPVALAS